MKLREVENDAKRAAEEGGARIRAHESELEQLRREAAQLREEGGDRAREARTADRAEAELAEVRRQADDAAFHGRAKINEQAAEVERLNNELGKAGEAVRDARSEADRLRAKLDEMHGEWQGAMSETSAQARAG